ncbi:Uncharacterised protein [Flavobacterium hibernum]|nr:hypothetical protein [Flavobacterium hibernum]STO10576.1 Uncharacterised protein [Flavobacterium hibernum]
MSLINKKKRRFSLIVEPSDGLKSVEKNKRFVFVIEIEMTKKEDRKKP